MTKCKRLFAVHRSFFAILAALFFLCLAYRPLYLLAAPLCVLALLVNYAAIICYVPFFCILLLYKLSGETDRKSKRMLLAAFIVCVCVSVAAYIRKAVAAFSYPQILTYAGVYSICVLSAYY